MIVRIKHPGLPDGQVFVPLAYDRDKDAWVPIVEKGDFFHRETTAISVCLLHVLEAWKSITSETALLRALCEHPLFRFEEDGIDDQMIRERAQVLHRHVRLIQLDLHRLLDEASEGDEVHYGGERLRLDEFTRTLPSLDLVAMSIQAEARSPRFGNPDELFPYLVALSFHRANEMSDDMTVTKVGLTRALVWLLERGAVTQEDLEQAMAATLADQSDDDFGEDETLERDVPHSPAKATDADDSDS